MVSYSINEIEELSGIKAHTLRVWEKRYQIVNPRRTATNVRSYTEEDLQKILKIALLYKDGVKISTIASYSESKIIEEINNQKFRSSCLQENYSLLVIAMLHFDSYKFIKIIDYNVEKRGFQQTMNTLINPFIERLPLLWVVGEITKTHKHFALNLIIRVLHLEISKYINKTVNKKPSLILFLPKNNFQTISLLYLQYILSKNNTNVINLGSNITFDLLWQAHKDINPNYAITIINEKLDDSNLESYYTKLGSLSNTKVLISGYHADSQNIHKPLNTKTFSSIEKLMVYLNDEKLINTN